MVTRIRARLTYANVAATIALVAALGGGIALALERNSVKSRHIADGQVRVGDANPAAFGRGLQFGAVDEIGAGTGKARFFPVGLHTGPSSLPAATPVDARLRDFRVKVSEPLTAGIRRFGLGTVVGFANFDLAKGLRCRLDPGESVCRAGGPSGVFEAGEEISFYSEYEGAQPATSVEFSWRVGPP